MSGGSWEGMLESKLQQCSSRQDAIVTMSLWLGHHKTHYQKIVNKWMKVLQKDKIEHRLVLFYIANDIIQNSKRKGFPHFANSFAEVLKEATLLVKDQRIRPHIARVFKIWGERNVYSSTFIADLMAILNNSKIPPSAPAKLLENFSPELVIAHLKSVAKLELEISSKSIKLDLSKLNATNSEIIQQLKDRNHGQKFNEEFEECTRQLQELVKLRKEEIKLRGELIVLLEQSEIYYDTQKGEAKVVVNAYRNFCLRVKTLQKKLGEIMETFPSPSPVPSPIADAPSPESDHDLELKLPNEPNQSLMPSFFNISTTSSNVTSQSDSIKPTMANLSSLESRLSNFFQPSQFQNMPFAGNPSMGGISLEGIGSPVKVRKETSTAEFSTPNKDDCSGQNTPLQDEDGQSSNKDAGKSPKDLLKGLKNSMSSNQTLSMPSFISSIPTNLDYFTASTVEPIRTVSAPTYQTSASEENVEDFIVPSSHVDNLAYESEPYPAEEYNPEMEIYDTDMDIDELEDDAIPSPENSPPLSPVMDDDISRPVKPRRLSTLITVVNSEDSPVQNTSNSDITPSDNPYQNRAHGHSSWSQNIQSYSTEQVMPDISHRKPPPDPFFGDGPKPPFFEPQASSYFKSQPPPLSNSETNPLDSLTPNNINLLNHIVADTSPNPMGGIAINKINPVNNLPQNAPVFSQSIFDNLNQSNGIHHNNVASPGSINSSNGPSNIALLEPPFIGGEVLPPKQNPQLFDTDYRIPVPLENRLPLLIEKDMPTQGRTNLPPENRLQRPPRSKMEDPLESSRIIIRPPNRMERSLADKTIQIPFSTETDFSLDSSDLQMPFEVSPENNMIPQNRFKAPLNNPRFFEHRGRPHFRENRNFNNFQPRQKNWMPGPPIIGQRGNRHFGPRPPFGHRLPFRGRGRGRGRPFF